MTKRRKKSRIQISEDDYYKAKGITREEAEASDYVPCIFKPRLALIPMAFAVGIMVWRYFAIASNVEKTYSYTIGLLLGICLAYLAIMEQKKKEFPVFMQWGMGICLALTIFIDSIIGLQCFLFLVFSWLWFVLQVHVPYSLFHRGRKYLALLSFVAMLLLGVPLYWVTGGVFMNQYFREIKFSCMDASSVQEIKFQQNRKKITICEANEIQRIIYAWKLYPFDSRHYRYSPPYLPEDHDPWSAVIEFKDGRKQRFSLACGLRQITDSVYLKDESNSWPNPFGIKIAYQSPELYKVLYPLLWDPNRKER